MKLLITGNLKHDGELYEADTVAEFDRETAQTLVKAGVAKFLKEPGNQPVQVPVQQEAPIQEPEAPQPPQEPERKTQQGQG